MEKELLNSGELHGHEKHREDSHTHHHDHEEPCSCGHHHDHGEPCGCGHKHHTEIHHEEREIPANHITKVYILENLGCANCAAKMEKKINQMEKVSNAVITFATKQLRISAEKPDSLRSEIEKICDGIESGVKLVEKQEIENPVQEHTEKKRDLFFILVGGILFLGAVVLHKIWGYEDYNLSFLIMFLVSYLILGGEILLTAGKNILRGQIFDENFLMSIATLGAFFIQEYPEAVGVMLFFRVGEYFEEIAVEKSRSQIMEAVDLRPEIVNLESDGDINQIPAEEAQVGDIVLVRPGDRIPLDGKIVEGESRIDTSAVTGEPVPVKAGIGSQAVSGCMNLSGAIKICVEKPLEESMVSRILNSVENAAASKPKIDHFITRFARIYTPIVVIIALFTAFGIPLILGEAFYPWIYTALSFLVMSCPCAVVLSVPLAFFCGIGAGSKRGILFKGGIVLEALKKVKVVVMDKTGTITKGNFEVQEIHTDGNWSKGEVLSFAA
ncbi:MAG: HAD-IC family P-type ATPase, partial [Lachnospiraceae bacterium]|nr:HAD-IC family P-type ATPase [Lachnospiraceae bacterium]